MTVETKRKADAVATATEQALAMVRARVSETAGKLDQSLERMRAKVERRHDSRAPLKVGHR